MYDIFHLPRFGRLLKKTVLERPMQLLGFTGAVLLTVFIYYAVYHLPPIQWFDKQKDSFLLGLTGGGAIFASFMFGYFSSNAQGCSYLTLPASHVEKWLCGVLIAGILYPMIFIVFFRIMDASFVGWFHHHLDAARPGYKRLYALANIFPFDSGHAPDVMMYFANYAGAMFVGSLLFNKLSFIKMLLVIGAIFLSVYLVNLVIAKLLFAEVQNAFPFDSVDIAVHKTSASGVAFSIPRQLELPLNAAKIQDILLRFLLPAALWTLAYVRLREKQF